MLRVERKRKENVVVFPGGVTLLDSFKIWFPKSATLRSKN